MLKGKSIAEIESMPYVEFMSHIEGSNRPPGGKWSVARIAQICNITKDSFVLDTGCNSGYVSLELARITGCKVVGIDIDPSMIKSANEQLELDIPDIKALVEFRVGDATHLPFEDNMFDVVVCGGSTAFMDDKVAALKEYARAAKPWGFVADVNFFYDQDPPERLLRELNDLLGITIEAWDKSYWIELYDSTGLEEYRTEPINIAHTTDKHIDEYCDFMAKQAVQSDDEIRAVKARLVETMSLFNENHRYLSALVSVRRKRFIPEEPSLFGA
ncbi:methyltransferase domain-containing protein [Candidatus Uhrbacteria bacterium]|nr:methyltransferase domain-containing protein [Candidatus Uhrbacteria bacterium]